MDRLNIFIDVDGTLTDGKLMYTAKGRFKSFDTRDGEWITKMKALGHNITLLTASNDGCARMRAIDLGIAYKEACLDKEAVVEAVSYNGCKSVMIGNAMNDLDAMILADYAMCPDDALDLIWEYCDFRSQHDGGDGAVAECLEYIHEKIEKVN